MPVIKAARKRRKKPEAGKEHQHGNAEDFFHRYLMSVYELTYRMSLWVKIL